MSKIISCVVMRPGLLLALQTVVYRQCWFVPVQRWFFPSSNILMFQGVKHTKPFLWDGSFDSILNWLHLYQSSQSVWIGEAPTLKMLGVSDTLLISSNSGGFKKTLILFVHERHVMLNTVWGWVISILHWVLYLQGSVHGAHLSTGSYNSDGIVYVFAHILLLCQCSKPSDLQS